MSKHTITFIQDITLQTVSILQDRAQTAVSNGATELIIYISTIGGNLDAGFAAYHFLRALPVKLTMHCIGNIESVGIIIFLAADRRLAPSQAKFKIHELHWDFPAGRVDHSRLKEYVESLDHDANRYVEIANERLKTGSQKLDVMAILNGNARILNGAEALGVGLVTQIEEASFPADLVGDRLPPGIFKSWW